MLGNGRVDVIELLGGWISQTWRLWVDALTLRPIGANIAETTTSAIPPLMIAAVSAIAMAIGQSVVLTANRIRRLALAFSLLFAIVAVLMQYTVQGFIVWFAANQLTSTALTAVQMTELVLVSAAPLVLAFLTAIPLIGPAISRILSVWSLLVLILAVQSAYAVSLPIAAVLTLGSWLCTLTLSNLAGPGLARVRDALWFKATKKSLHPDTAFILAMVEDPTPQPRPHDPGA